MPFDLPQRTNLVSGTMMQADVRPDRNAGFATGLLSNVVKNVQTITKSLYDEERKIKFDQYDIKAQGEQKLLLQTLDGSNYKDFDTINQEWQKQFTETVSQDEFGKDWLKEKGNKFLAFNNYDVGALKIKKHNQYVEDQLNKTISELKTMSVNAKNPKEAKVNLEKAKKLAQNSKVLTPEQIEKQQKQMQKQVDEDRIYTLLMEDPYAVLAELQDKNNFPSISPKQRDSYLKDARNRAENWDEQKRINDDNIQLYNLYDYARSKEGVLTVSDLQLFKDSLVDKEGMPIIGELTSKTIGEMSNNMVDKETTVYKTTDDIENAIATLEKIDVNNQAMATDTYSQATLMLSNIQNAYLQGNITDTEVADYKFQINEILAGDLTSYAENNAKAKLLNKPEKTYTSISDFFAKSFDEVYPSVDNKTKSIAFDTVSDYQSYVSGRMPETSIFNYLSDYAKIYGKNNPSKDELASFILDEGNRKICNRINGIDENQRVGSTVIYNGQKMVIEQYEYGDILLTPAGK